MQQDPTQALIARLRNEVELLKKENGYLRGQLGMPLDFQIPGLAQMPGPREQRTGSRGGRRRRPASASGTRRAAPGGPLGFGGTRPAFSARAVMRSRSVTVGAGSGPSGAGVTRRPKGRDPMDDELAGSVPLDPQFLGMNKADLASRVLRAEQLLGKYTDENHRLERENDALRGGKQLLEMEHKSALEDVAELSARLSSLEHTFLTDADGTAEAFGLEDAGRGGGVADVPGLSHGGLRDGEAKPRHGTNPHGETGRERRRRETRADREPRGVAKVARARAGGSNV